MLKKGLIAGVAIFVVGFVLQWGIQSLIPGLTAQYQNPELFRPWTDPLMMAAFAYPFVLGLVLAYLWDRLKMKDPMEFAKLYFIIASIPGMYITYTSFTVSLTMVLVWTVTGFVQAYTAGHVFTKMK